MRSDLEHISLDTATAWMDLTERFGGSRHYVNSIQMLRSLGAKTALLEGAYIDRDHSVSHSKFYSTLFQPSTKYCRRIHFFAASLPTDLPERTARERIKELATFQKDYLGFLVIRPLPHAPVSWGVISAERVQNTKVRIPIQGRYRCHVQGSELLVVGAPSTEQDGRVGACAQAAAWIVGRHTNVRHGGGWYSVSAITELALTSVDHWISRGLPAGSGALSLDGMLRALRAMERHPLVIGPNQELRNSQAANHTRANGNTLIWKSPPAEVIWQYLDSQIPVIVGLRRGSGIGHAVVAVGVQQKLGFECGGHAQPTFALGAEHFIVQDDQEGPYRPLLLKSEADDDESLSLEDCQYLVVPMPDKVFLTGEDAEALARDLLSEIVSNRDEMLEDIEGDAYAPLDPQLVKAAVGGQVVARTYLSHGWSYQRRAIENDLPPSLREEIAAVQFPRFVWVTEFFLPEACKQDQLSQDCVVAHIVIDATGSQYWDSYLVADVPGLAIVWDFEASDPLNTAGAIFLRTNRINGYAPKTGSGIL